MVNTNFSCSSCRASRCSNDKICCSDNKEDLKKNPLKFVAKKLIVLPYGALVRGGGAVLKTMTNPLYPIQSIKKAWRKRSNYEKHQSMVINH